MRSSASAGQRTWALTKYLAPAVTATFLFLLVAATIGSANGFTPHSCVRFVPNCKERLSVYTRLSSTPWWPWALFDHSSGTDEGAAAAGSVDATKGEPDVAGARPFKGFGTPPPPPAISREEPEEEESHEAPTAPEVNKWTTLMADGTNAAIHRPGREMTMQEAIESLYNDLKDMSDYDNEQVELYWDKIMPTVSNLGTTNSYKVKQALRVAYRAHRGQCRKSGEPFIIHPVEVSLLLSGLNMDAETVMSGLLHDTVEDTDLTFTQVEAMFGKVVRSIVEGETKVSKLPKLAFNDYADEQAENLRQMFVAMTDDYRIIIVKLADRLHNMRTLRFMKPEKQKKISRETLDIFAPLAHRMGIWQFKSELEDTAFMYLYPKEYKELNRMLRRRQKNYRETLDKSQDILKRTLALDKTLRDQAAEVQVYGRTKELYSLWHKMETKADHDLDQVVDVVALRVVIDPKPIEEDEPDPDGEGNVADRGVWLCYHVLGLVQHLPGFQPVPTKVKDYISFPKPNGYQSIHTALMLNGQNIEVQIRTEAMHQVAEFGMASHWSYTDEKKRPGFSGANSKEDLYNTPWLSSIKDWNEDAVCSRDFVDCVRRELLGKRVFVFLRNGKILNLSRGATVIDAAFQIHTEVGLEMHGATINGKPVPFSYELQNGDVVSILTGEGKPETDWMRYAKSRSTRSKLRSYFRARQKESLRHAGEILVMDFLGRHRDLIKDASFLGKEDEEDKNMWRGWEVPTTLDELSLFLPGRTQFQEVDELLIAVGKSHERMFFRGIMSKIFRVPLALLTEAEEERSSSISQNVANAVNESRKQATDAASVAWKPGTNGQGMKLEKNEGVLQYNDVPANGAAITNGLSLPADVADPDHVCEDCLPILGDDIVGTRPADRPDNVPTVHRQGCPHAQRALNRADSSREKANDEPKTSDSQNDVQVGKREARHKSSQRFSSTSAFVDEVPIALRWSDESILDTEDTIFLAEIVVVASDRKLLLADCSEIVSEMSEIVKTGSATTKEHATLEFLVKTTSVHDLQKVMDCLQGVDSVMSVERRFGSQLL
eukprot:CAMPEP_0113556114 /NCGR_PEP_ID=MMETSP0015_2-20120614/17082_1 /TAXON_ID=2838 /ORGANISM="Odontella" /LENGTH=1056 /DNA_ID=CAMNT_0000457445 /DNA_START=199 /DNA_END=3369 /DNA_ORIENTATION=+ /assembly_acc=CAM_ASM_000160